MYAVLRRLRLDDARGRRRDGLLGLWRTRAEGRGGGGVVREHRITER